MDGELWNFTPGNYPTQVPRTVVAASGNDITFSHPGDPNPITYTSTITLTIPTRVKLLSLSGRAIFKSIDFTVNDQNIIKVTAETQLNGKALQLSGTSESEVFFFGGARTFHISELSSPIYVEPSDSLTLKVTAVIGRSTSATAVFTANISFSGEQVY